MATINLPFRPIVEIPPSLFDAAITRHGTGWTFTFFMEGLDRLALPEGAELVVNLRHPALVNLPEINLGRVGDLGNSATAKLDLGTSLRTPERCLFDVSVDNPATGEFVARSLNLRPVVVEDGGTEDGKRASTVRVRLSDEIGRPVQAVALPEGPFIYINPAPRGSVRVFEQADLLDPMVRAVFMPGAYELWVLYALENDAEAGGPFWDAFKRQAATIVGAANWSDFMERGEDDLRQKAARAGDALYARSGIADQIEKAVRAAMTQDTVEE